MTLKTLIPEWPKINGSRPAIIGIKGGADHPFGALLIVTTELGLVVVDEYLERQQANITHKHALVRKFETAKFTDMTWAVSETEKELRMEFAVAGVPMLAVPNARAAGIQRVQSWLAAGQLFFVGQKCQEALRQLRRYRYAENVLPDGQKRERENVFRADDELPEALGVAMLAWPDLPKPTPAGMTDRERKRWDALDEGSRQDIERWREYDAKALRKGFDLDDPEFAPEFFGTHDQPW